MSSVGRDSKGFTLIEIIVALTIAMLSLSAMMAIVTPARKSTLLSAQFLEATRYARNHLEAIGSDGRIPLDTQSGEDGGGFSWTMRAQRVADHLIPPPDSQSGGPPPTLGLVEIEVTERWRTGSFPHALSLRTRKLRLIEAGN